MIMKKLETVLDKCQKHIISLGWRGYSELEVKGAQIAFNIIKNTLIEEKWLPNDKKN